MEPEVGGLFNKMEAADMKLRRFHSDRREGFQNTRRQKKTMDKCLIGRVRNMNQATNNRVIHSSQLWIAISLSLSYCHFKGCCTLLPGTERQRKQAALCFIRLYMCNNLNKIYVLVRSLPYIDYGSKGGTLTCTISQRAFKGCHHEQYRLINSHETCPGPWWLSKRDFSDSWAQ